MVIAVVVVIEVITLGMRIEDGHAAIADLHGFRAHTGLAIDHIVLDRRHAIGEIRHVLHQCRTVFLAGLVECLLVGDPDIHDRRKLRRRAARGRGNRAQLESFDRVAIETHDRLQVMVPVVVGVELDVRSGRIEDRDAVHSDVDHS